jgi:predicted HicB family RNase H-like nuclease
MDFRLSSGVPSYGFSLTGPMSDAGDVRLGLVGLPQGGDLVDDDVSSARDEGSVARLASSANASASELKKLSIVLPKEVHQKAKLLALSEDITLTSMITDLLRQRIREAGV